MKYYHNYSTIPEHIHQGFEYYLIHGIKPGSFLSSVIANDLIRSVQCADSINLTQLHNIALWVFDNMPQHSYGSYESLDRWSKDKSGIRSAYVKQIKEFHFWEAMGQKYEV